MAKRLFGTICLSRIPKQYIFTGKDGQKYISINVWENREGVDRYGNSHSVMIGLTREQRERDNNKYYIGNLKSSEMQSSQPAATVSSPNGYRQQGTNEPVSHMEHNEDLPF